VQLTYFQVLTGGLTSPLDIAERTMYRNRTFDDETVHLSSNGPEYAKLSRVLY
jgi:hypothetical protein